MTMRLGWLGGECSRASAGASFRRSELSVRNLARGDDKIFETFFRKRDFILHGESV